MEDRTLVRSSAPPPPSEVKVRTMKSDLASMAQSGGGIPRFQDVAVDGLSVEREEPAPRSNPMPPAAASPAEAVLAARPSTQPITAPQAVVNQPVQASIQPSPNIVASPATPSSAPKKDFYPILIVIVIALLAIGGVSYFAYVTLFSGTPATPSNSGTPTTQPSSTTGGAAATTPTTTTSHTGTNTGATIPASMELSSAHVSLFTKPADQTITVTLVTANATTYRKSMQSSLASANAGATMIEIHPQGTDGGALNINGLLTAAGASSIIDQQTLGSFNPDATFFVYHDSLGWWPGYVLQLASGSTSSGNAAGADIEQSGSALKNLFLSDPGTPSSDGFTDSTISNMPVRVLLFAGIAAPSYFTYGWDGNYLILSTSQNGFGAAVANLPQ